MTHATRGSLGSLRQLTRSPFLRAAAVGWTVAALPLLLWPGLGSNLLRTAGFEAHGHADLWPASLLSLHLLSDASIGVSYVAISGMLAYLVHRARRDIPFHWIILAFGLFIVACGMTHFMHLLVLWTPVFWLDGYVKLVTAVASVTTAVVLPPLIPAALNVVRSAKLSERRRLELEARTAELEERNAEQETFLYTVSHDLRAPLLSIRGMAGVLEEALARGDGEEAAYALNRIAGNAAKMEALLGDLLGFSRAGRESAPAEVFDLGDVAATALAELEPRLAERGVRVELPERWPRVCYPPSEAYQVVANLLGNAAKFAGRADEAGLVRVSWRPEDDRVSLSVSDNGRGVPEAYRDRVFGLFQKADPAAEGTGVGLAIVKRIAERHGGSVWVEDSPPPPEGLGGAAFTVTMPAARRE